MTTLLPAGKLHRNDDRARSRNASRGVSAATLAPPAYGVDFVDSAKRGLAPLQRIGKLQSAEGKEWLQEIFDSAPAQPRELQLPPSPHGAGMPDRLKAGIEWLSGMDLSDVRVHANSARPARLNALAYAHGNDIHLAPGQERNLPHEAWHMVQQRQGRVRETMRGKGVKLNDDAALEKEAEAMGAKAARTGRGGQRSRSGLATSNAPDGRRGFRPSTAVVQRVLYPVANVGMFDYDMRPAVSNDQMYGEQKYGMVGAIDFMPDDAIDDTDEIALVQIVRNARDAALGEDQAQRSHTGFVTDVPDEQLQAGEAGLAYAAGPSLVVKKLHQSEYLDPDHQAFDAKRVARGRHGYKRKGDKREATLYDQPSTTQTPNRWDFQTVARDMQHRRDLATLNWGFEVSAKNTVNESKPWATRAISAAYVVSTGRHIDYPEINKVFESNSRWSTSGRIRAWHDADMLLKIAVTHAEIEWGIEEDDVDDIINISIRSAKEALGTNPLKPPGAAFFKALDGLQNVFRVE